MADCTLSMDNLCVKCGRICWLKSKSIVAEDVQLNTLCSQVDNTKQLNADAASVGNLCADTAVINNLCVNNLSSPNIRQCNKYRFYSKFTADSTYNLGSTINFNDIVDDPNGNVSISPQTAYTVPVSGYYALSLFLNASNLSGSGIINGTAIAQLSVDVNGVLTKETSVPFLSFNSNQKSTFTAHLYLTAGDVVTVQYDLLVMDPVSGTIPYVGTMVLKGGVLTSEVSTWDMILLSELCGGGVAPVCAPCKPVLVTCVAQPISTDCVPPPPPAGACTFSCS